jgi:predicted amidohydrolase
MRVAGLQTEIAWEDPTASFRRIDPWIAAAAAAGARLVVLPEMFACGFSMRTEVIRESPEGPSTRFLLDRAHTHGVFVCGSVPELPPGEPKPFNTLVLAGPDGRLVRYRKIHPFSYAGEHEHYGAGTAHVTTLVEDVRVTLFVCYDLRFADEFWIAAPDTDLYVVVANWPTPRREHWRTLLRARAIENQAYVIGVNRVGSGGSLEYAGDSAIVDPLGATLAEASGGETMILADVEPDVVRSTRERLPFLRDRR